MDRGALSLVGNFEPLRRRAAVNAGTSAPTKYGPSPARNESRTKQWNRVLPSLRILPFAAPLPRAGRICADPASLAGDSTPRHLAHPGLIGVAAMPDPLPV